MRGTAGQDRPWTIVHIAWEYPPRIVGGLGVHVAGLAQAQAARGHRVFVVTPGRFDVDRHAPGFGEVGRVTVLRAGHRPTPQGGPFLWQLDRLGADLVACALTMLGREPGRLDGRAGPAGLATRQQGDGGPILLHAHDWLAAPAALRLSRQWHSPLAVTFHATEAGRKGREAERNAYSRAVSGWERRLAAQAAVRFAPSHSLAAEVSALGGGPVCVAPGGFWPGSPVWPRKPDPGRMLIAARLVPDKGVSTALRALARLLGGGLPLHLDLAGRGSQEARLRELAEELGIAENVSFLGHVSRTRLDHLRQRAALCLVPSLYEPFGLAALEAAVAGVPLVASCTGGLAEWAGPVARLVPPGDVDALTGAIRESLADRSPLPADSVREELAHLAWSETARRMDASLARWA